MIYRHLLAYLPLYAAQALVGFGSVVGFTRILSPDDYGRYMMALSAAALLGTFVFTWLDAAIVRYHARSKARGRLGGHLFTAIETYAVLAALSLLVLAGVLFVWPMSGELKTLIAVSCTYAVLRSAVTLCVETRRAAGEAWRYSLLETSSTLMGFFLAIGIVLLTDLGPSGPFVGMAIASILVFLFDAPILMRKAKRDRANSLRRATFIAFGAPVAISLVFEGLLTTSDRFIVAAILGEAATGAYAAGYAIADRSISIVFLWLGSATAPLMVIALENHDAETTRKTARQTAKLMGLFGFPAATGLALVSESAARLLIGEALQEDAARVIPLIALSGLMNGIMTYYFHEAFTLGRQPKIMAGVMAGAAVFNVGLNFVLIPVFGIIGAALSTVVAYAGALIICILVGRRIFPLPIPFSDWVQTALACALMAAGVLSLPTVEPVFTSLLLEISTGVLIFSLTALALNIADCRSFVTATLAARRKKAEA